MNSTLDSFSLFAFSFASYASFSFLLTYVVCLSTRGFVSGQKLGSKEYPLE
jgi:hypothetical protein